MALRAAIRFSSLAALAVIGVSSCTATGPGASGEAAAPAPSATDTACAALAAETDISVIVEAGEPIDGLALDIADCLGRADPDIRDGFAYESLARLLRAGLVPLAERQRLLTSVSASVNAHAIDTKNGGSGFLAPFAALVLSEIARTDRVEPWMSDEQRAALVETGASYVESVRDYRGFIEGEGWRHGVAHGADLLMQLSLNPAIGEEEAARIMRAVGKQIASNEAPAFIFDEPRRLARPILFLTQRGLLGQEQLDSWFEWMAEPAPLASWDDAFQSESALARRHNLRAFAYAILVSATENEDENLKMLRPGALHVLSTIP